jgi:hypothetical protein
MLPHDTKANVSCTIESMGAISQGHSSRAVRTILGQGEALAAVLDVSEGQKGAGV